MSVCTNNSNFTGSHVTINTCDGKKIQVTLKEAKYFFPDLVHFMCPKDKVIDLPFANKEIIRYITCSLLHDTSAPFHHLRSGLKIADFTGCEKKRVNIFISRILLDKEMRSGDWKSINADFIEQDLNRRLLILKTKCSSPGLIVHLPYNLHEAIIKQMLKTIRICDNKGTVSPSTRGEKSPGNWYCSRIFKCLLIYKDERDYLGLFSGF